MIYAFELTKETDKDIARFSMERAVVELDAEAGRAKERRAVWRRRLLRDVMGPLRGWGTVYGHPQTSFLGRCMYLDTVEGCGIFLAWCNMLYINSEL